MRDSVLSVNELSKSYGRNAVPVLKNLSFEVAQGATTGFLGLNGAGKTTTLLCILDLLYPDSGSVKILGGSIHEPEIKKRIGVMFDRPSLYGFLSGEETLEVHGKLLGMDAPAIRRRTEELVEIFQLCDFIKKRVSTYSLGTKQKLSFAQAVIGEPDLLILDEPLSGLDPLVTAEIRRYISEYTKKEGKSIFMSSHMLSEVENLCNSVVVIHKGRLVHSGPLGEWGKERVKFRVMASSFPIGLPPERYFIRDMGGGVYDVIVKSGGAPSPDEIQTLTNGAACQQMPITLEDLFLENVS